ncbi:pleckstrin homology domain-containing family A member 2-like [Liolophura sinensis]|uniref:pleckstrin homology domain-containing family A member 2-like n=1 Tax=Liolophura sinensis TaxID=3198878 RepID=UPI003158014B
MPYKDKAGRTCGFLDIEEREDSSRFSRRYFILDVTMGKFSYYMDVPSNLSSPMPVREFNLQYISKVTDGRKLRPKVEFCFVINVEGKNFYLQADSEKDLQNWIDAITNASKITVPNNESRSDTMEWHYGDTSSGYKTEIAGGVVCKIAVDSDDSDGSDREDSSTSGQLSAGAIPSIKSGFCVKQGAVRKNWKRRFFVLDHSGISYYSSNQDKTPIKTINKHDILEVRESKGVHSGRDNLFEIVTAKRIYYIQTDCPEDMHSWIEVLRKVLRTLKCGDRKSMQEIESQPVDLDCSSDLVYPPKGVWTRDKQSGKESKKNQRRKNRSWFWS